jgi:hypothetical protein
LPGIVANAALHIFPSDANLLGPVVPGEFDGGGMMTMSATLKHLKVTFAPEESGPAGARRLDADRVRPPR